jgi:hypothetical protein
VRCTSEAYRILTEGNELFQVHDGLFKEIPVAGVSDEWTCAIDTISISSKKVRMSIKPVDVGKM